MPKARLASARERKDTRSCGCTATFDSVRTRHPFKTHVSAELRRSFTDSECLLYIHLSPERSFVAAGVWQASRDLLQAWRDAMIRDPERFEKMRRALERAKLPFSEEYSLSSMPRGLQSYAAQPIGRWLKLTSFVVSRQLANEECATGAPCRHGGKLCRRRQTATSVCLERGGYRRSFRAKTPERHSIPLSIKCCAVKAGCSEAGDW